MVEAFSMIKIHLCIEERLRGDDKNFILSAILLESYENMKTQPFHLSCQEGVITKQITSQAKKS